MTDRPSAPEDPSDRNFRRSLLSVLVAALVGLLVMATVAAFLMAQGQDFNRWVEHTYLVQSRIALLDADVERAETARRGYLLVPAARFREVYDQARDAAPRDVQALRRLTADNPRQQGRLAEVGALLEARGRRVSEMMRLASRGEVEAAVESFRKDRDQSGLEKVRRLTAGMGEEEGRLLRLREGHALGATRALFAVVVLGGALLLLLTFLATALMRRYARDLERVQGAVRRLNFDLEDRVAERTSELVRANEEIQRFAYIVSHDLRSPLVNVMGFTSELETGLAAIAKFLDGEAREVPKTVTEAVRTEMPEAIGFIRSSSRKMDRLINAILRLSREGRRTLNAERVDMTRLLSDLLDGVRHRLVESGAEAGLEGELPPLTADRLALEQVFGNLVDNAVKYFAPDRAGRIRVRGRREGSRLVYEVEDNGRGIDPKDHQRVFELFRRAGAQDQPGEGIGLAHVLALVYRLGGRIDLRSELGRGATFILSFPAA